MQFKSYFQLLPNQADIDPAYFGVIRKFQWRRVHLIVQNENLFTVVSNATLLEKIMYSLGYLNFNLISKAFSREFTNF